MNKFKVLTTAVAQRDEEIFGYQINIDNYTTMLAELPREWPPELLEYRGLELCEMVRKVEDEQARTLAADLIFADRLAQTLAVEKLEQRKAILVRAAMRKQLEAIECPTS
jgi:hypothetical protein